MTNLKPSLQTKFKIKPRCVVFPNPLRDNAQSDGLQSTNHLMKMIRQDLLHFNCMHCLYIVDDPQECSQCEALICRDCLNLPSRSD
mmetsp:Transcript_12069/g.18638  ORF Transcript_12069/g.18638 Transcript_12069/m.18638 type:complete len:86 (-) Transcript_12069:540-797(-)